MKKICFATSNKHKLKEIQDLLRYQYEIISLDDLGFDEEIEETGSTLDENAAIKAQTISKRFNMDCFADDTGLEVKSLNGAPGVYSARYAGEHATYSDNVNKLLDELTTLSNREAKFRTVICLIKDGEEHFFEGEVKGVIIDKPRGQEGFGYDPVFKPDGFEETFAEMQPVQKNAISHRGRAIRKLADFLKSNETT